MGTEASRSAAHHLRDERPAMLSSLRPVAVGAREAPGADRLSIPRHTAAYAELCNCPRIYIHGKDCK